MPPVQREGDVNDNGGPAVNGFASVRVNGRPIVVDGTTVAEHGPSNVTANGVGSVRAGGIPVNVDGNADACKHSRTGGSGDVRAG